MSPFLIKHCEMPKMVNLVFWELQLSAFLCSSWTRGRSVLGRAPCWWTSSHAGLQHLQLLPQTHQGDLAQRWQRGQPWCHLHGRAGRRRLVLPAALSPGVHAQVSRAPRQPAGQRPQTLFTGGTSVVLEQVWRKDLLCGGARQPKNPSDKRLG